MTVALIVAAGSGERLGAALPKAFVELAGQPMLNWSIAALRRTPGVSHIVVALPAGVSPPAGIFTETEGELIAVEGGAVRSESVRRALAAAPPGDPVLVHDAARPLIEPELASAVIAALQADPSAQAAIAAAPVADTIKRAGPAREVLETLPRDLLWAVQTPQVFRRRALERALDVGPEELAAATDDASLIERGGGRVILVPSLGENLKVTTTLDLRVAELVLAERHTRGTQASPA